MTDRKENAALPGGRTRPAVVMLATALVCLPILAASQLLSHIRADEFDAWLFAYYGRQLLAGHELYSQLWDNKPPGIFWLNAIGQWLSGGTLVGPWALCAAAVTASCAVFFAVARRLYGLGTAAITTLMAALFLNHQFFHVGCNRPNTFFVLTELVALLLYVRALSVAKGQWRGLLLAGVCAGLGLWFKQSALAVAVGVGVHQIALAVTRCEGVAATLRRLVWFGVGWIAAIAGMFALLALTADLGWAWHAIVAFNREYFVAPGGSRLLPEWFGIREQVHVLALPGLLALATLVHAVAVRLSRSEKPPTAGDPRGERPALLLVLLWAWMLAALYLALLGPHQRLPYYGIVLPPMCVLAAHGVFLWLRSGRGAAGKYPPYYVVLGVLWFAYMLITPLENQFHELNRQYYLAFEDADADPERRQATGQFIAERTAADETMFVWAYDPEVYWHAGRPSAIRYIATEKAAQLGAAGQPIMDETIKLLQAARPKVIVISPSWLEKLADPPERDPLTYGDFAAWVRENYDLAPGSPRGNVWIRRE